VGANTALEEFTAGFRLEVSDSLDMQFGFAYHTILGASPGIGFQYQ
jgi:hypothetical protein